jgi:hypothetical protein
VVLTSATRIHSPPFLNRCIMLYPLAVEAYPLKTSARSVFSKASAHTDYNSKSFALCWAAHVYFKKRQRMLHVQRRPKEFTRIYVLVQANEIISLSSLWQWGGGEVAECHG